MDKSSRTAGAQSLRRALQLLRLLARYPDDGLKLGAVIDQSGLTRSTVHRLLSCLLEEQFAERDRSTHRYRLGIDAMQLGFASMRGAALISQYRPQMQKVARISGDTVFLLVRQGDYSVCLHREEGHFPVRVFTTNVGERRLLGIGAGGLGLMATLPDAEIERIMKRNTAEYVLSGFTPARMGAAVERTRQAAYSEIADTVTKGVSGVGCVFQASPSSLAAVSIGAITSRLSAPRKQELALLLMDEFTQAPAAAQTPAGK